MELALVVGVIAIALVFSYTNGFHDAANAIATSVSTRALTPRAALLLAAVMNMAGAMLGTGVAETIGSGIVDVPQGPGGLVVVLAGLIGAIAWNVITWWWGMPSSSSHALIGGLLGAGLASVSTVHWQVVRDLVVLPMILTPLLGFAVAYAVMLGLLWLLRNTGPGRTHRRFRIAQTVSAAAMALGHGLQDAQKTMGVIVLALVAGGLHQGTSIPLWVKLCAAVSIALGTYAGGWRIMRTLGRRMISLDPARGFVAESVAASVLYTAAFVFHAPISTTYTIAATIAGAGSSQRLSAVRWGVARSMAGVWLLTVPASALIAAIVFGLLSLPG